MKLLRTIFTIVGLVLVQSGAAALADQYWMPVQGASSPARPDYATPGVFHRFVGDDSATLPTNYQAEAVMERGLPPAACTAPACTSPSSCGRGACDLDPCNRGLLWDPWVTFEYMHSWRRPRSLPPLVTTSSVPGVDGRLPDATVLFGDADVGGNLLAAGRLSFGAWLDEDRILGAGGKFFASGQDATTFGIQSDATGSPLIARPFFNTDPAVNAQDALILTSPNLREGSLEARATNDLLTAEAYGSYLLYACRGRRLDFIAGYQFARIDDSLTINSRSTQLQGGSFPPGTRFSFEDVFSVRNTYNGGELGLLGEYNAGPITFSALGKIGLGNMHQVLTIDGTSSLADVGVANPPITRGGLLAQPQTNMGTYTFDKFCVVPEADIKMIYHLTRRLDFSLGYSLVYWNNVALAADQIDTSMSNTPTVNASQLLGGPLVGPANPAGPATNGIRETDFWVQGITFGLTLKL